MKRHKGNNVNSSTFMAFRDELSKISSQTGNLNRRAKSRVDYHFSPKAGEDRWVKFLRNVQDPRFVEQLSKRPEADETLIQHAQGLHDLSVGKTVGKVYSSRLPGRSYEIKDIPKGLGCTCPDWRFNGSIKPGYECKHIRAHEAGKVKAIE
jgi:hypothetical protein